MHDLIEIDYTYYINLIYILWADNTAVWDIIII